MKLRGLSSSARSLGTRLSVAGYRPQRWASPRLVNRARPSPSWTDSRTYTSVSAADLRFGQPVYETHPHLLNAGELTPGITAQEYADRRAKLADGLPDGAVAVLPASTLKLRSGAVFFPYRQESNFYYLTGFVESDAVAVIQKTGKQLGDYVFHLFVRAKDPKMEQWEGPRSGIDAARDVFNADGSGDVEHLDTLLPPLLEKSSSIYTDVYASVNGDEHHSLRKLIDKARGRLSRPRLNSLSPLVHNLRAIKSPAEVVNMRRAGQLSGRAYTAAMRLEWTREKSLAASLEYGFVANGCDSSAYVPVVAGGANGLTIHYVLNNDVLNQEDMVLVDAGGEYGTYITDITRTWPVSGKFTAAQKDLYEAVLRVQRTSVSLCRESAKMTLDGIHRITQNGLKDQLRQLGFDVSGNAMDVLFPHHVGHYVGLDVHDVPGYPRGIPLKAGHCVTIEPGVYVPDDERWPGHFRGMAIRIEDSVCVDDDSPHILTTEAVKEVVDIEALRS